jgi:hypothetical protein
MSTPGGGRNSSDGKINKHQVMSTLQYDLFLAYLNKLDIAKLGDTSVSPPPKMCKFRGSISHSEMFGFVM